MPNKCDDDDDICIMHITYVRYVGEFIEMSLINALGHPPAMDFSSSRCLGQEVLTP